jgi:hypothetical protein
MIIHCKKAKRHIFTMSEENFQTFAEVIFLLKHTPPPIGFNRKPFTAGQVKIIEEVYSRMGYSDDYGEYLNKLHGQ